MENIYDYINKKDSFIILVIEDDSFHLKIKKDFNLKPNILIKYSKRKILKIYFYEFSYKVLFQKRILISEYFNAIPRIIGFLTIATTLSIIYGSLSYDNFKKRRSWIKKLLIPLYADNYLVVNRKATFETLNAIYPKKVNFISIERQKPVIKKSNKFNVWISQAWAEIGREDIELFQQQCINRLQRKNDLYIVLHPRDTSSKYTCFEDSRKINNISGLMELIEKVGYPKKIYGLTSSVLLELRDYNIEATRIEHELLNTVNKNQELLNLKSIDPKNL